jgi:endonuclease V-like protein UPF0215 family
MIQSITVTATIVLIHGLVACGNTPAKYDGCYNPATNTITINTQAKDVRYVLLHEIAHAKFNNKPEIQELFINAPVIRPYNQDNVWEKMADWFTKYWDNAEYFNNKWKTFFSS